MGRSFAEESSWWKPPRRPRCQRNVPADDASAEKPGGLVAANGTVREAVQGTTAKDGVIEVTVGVVIALENVGAADGPTVEATPVPHCHHEAECLSGHVMDARRC
ncbi:hypothetical protein TcCL_Unassigned01082 [Trypanosoma cruzi]|nr:hypothetical protein TcCL_Unassigned01082 [Trypanosoma cruzi]